MGRNGNGEHLSELLLTGGDSFLEGARGHTTDLLHWAQKMNQCCDVIRAHVEHRAATDLVEKCGVRVPRFRAAGHHERRAAENFSDPSIVHHFPCGLESGSEKGVRCAAHKQPLFPGKVDHFFGILQMDRQRFFAMHVLAGIERCKADLSMDRRDGEIDDQIHVGIRQQLIHRLGHAAVFCGLGLGGFWVEIGAGDHFKDLEKFSPVEVGLGNVSATDNADADFGFVLHGWSLFVAAGDAGAREVMVAFLNSLHHVAGVAVEFDGDVFRVGCGFRGCLQVHLAGARRKEG